MIRPITFALTALALTAGCVAGPRPETQLYRLDVRAAAAPEACARVGPVLVVEDFEVDGAYDDARMTYRQGRYALSRYHYHRWSAAPGVLVADAFRGAYQHTCSFAAVRRGRRQLGDVALSGRILRIEEVDLSASAWQAELALELTAQDVKSGKVIWRRSEAVSVPLEEQSPRGLADAMSALVWRVADRTTPTLLAAVRAHAEGVVAAAETP